jgi:hypothetical protein
MTSGRQSSAALAAILFALFYGASLFGVMDLPEGVDTDQSVLRAYAESGNRTGLIVGVYLLAAAGLSFLWFLGSLRDAVRRHEESTSRLSTLVLAGGLVYVVMLFGAGASFGVLPLAVAVDEISVAQIDPTLARVLVNFGFVLLLVFGLAAAAAMVLVASIAALRTGVLPRWLAWAGLPLAALLLLGPMYMPQLLVPIWAVTVGIVLARSPVPATSRAELA